MGGAALAIVTIVWVSRVSLNLFAPAVLLLAALPPLPATIDWVSQAVDWRESTNSLRWVTGAGLGFSEVFLINLAVEQQWQLFLGGSLIFGLYATGIITALARSGRLERVVDEHFPQFRRSHDIPHG